MRKMALSPGHIFMDLMSTIVGLCLLHTEGRLNGHNNKFLDPMPRVEISQDMQLLLQFPSLWLKS